MKQIEKKKMETEQTNTFLCESEKERFTKRGVAARETEKNAVGGGGCSDY
jgi:hypothetical protein